jgi:hypothetical protein
MPEEQLSKDKDFKVNEMRACDVMIGIVYLLLFIPLIINIVMDFNKISAVGYAFFARIVVLILLGVLIYFQKARLNLTALTVNKEGIYCYKNFVTDWANFIEAYYTEQPVTGSTSDHFVLMINYTKPGEDGTFLREIGYSDTFNKSQEEIIAAITYFSGGELGKVLS